MSNAILEELIAIGKARTVPGIFLFNENGKLLFSNKEAFTTWKNIPSGKLEESNIPYIHEKISKIYKQFKKELFSKENKNDCAVDILTDKNNFFLLRGILLHSEPDKEHPALLILIEKISLTKVMNIESASKFYNLSHREVDVVHELIKGKSNKEIGLMLNICENTVKDHIKSIRKKFNVTSKNKIIAKLINIPKK